MNERFRWFFASAGEGAGEMHIALVTAVAVTFAWVAPGWAQSTGEGCAAVEDGGARLLCYDAIFRIKAVDRPVDSGTGSWSVRSEQSRITDKTDVFVSVDSNQVVPDRFGGAGTKATLLLRCKDNSTSFTVWFGGQFMASSGGFDRVTYRIDDLPAEQSRWEESTNNEHMGLWNGGQSIPLIKALFGHSNFLLQATPYNESSVTLDFNVAGVENAVADLRKACNW